MSILGIHHVNVQVADVAAARHFYGNVLGLTEIERPGFSSDGLWFQIGPQQLHIAEAKDHRGPERQHYAIQVSDLEAVASAIERHGIAVRRSAESPAGAGRQAFLRDPSGNLIELNQPGRTTTASATGVTTVK